MLHLLFINATTHLGLGYNMTTNTTIVSTPLVSSTLNPIVMINVALPKFGSKNTTYIMATTALHASIYKGTLVTISSIVDHLDMLYAPSFGNILILLLFDSIGMSISKTTSTVVNQSTSMFMSMNTSTTSILNSEIYNILTIIDMGSDFSMINSSTNVIFSNPLT